MLTKAISILSLVTLLVSCNSQKSGEKQSSLANCYSYASGGDTVTLKIIHVGESITGGLVYNFKEKDKNKGTILGTMSGDVLVADYTFISEDIQSVRQVAFKLEGDHFVEGYGDTFITNDKVRFKNIDSLHFNTGMKLEEIPCR